MTLQVFSTEEIQMMYDRSLQDPGAISRGFTTCLCGDVAARRLGIQGGWEVRMLQPGVEKVNPLSSALYGDLYGAVSIRYWKESSKRAVPFHEVVSLVLREELERRASPSKPAAPKGWVDQLIESTKEIKETVAHCFCLWS